MTEVLRDAKTIGASPKAIAATVAPLIAGVVLMLLDLAAVIEVNDELWIGLLGIAPVAGGAAVAASPGTVKADRTNVDPIPR
jgi:hypothetical protein